MELRPHLFLEGVIVAMRFAEAEHGWIYLREEYATARDRLARAIEELRAAGLLEGRTLELVVGAGAYIAGEETAMLESMEGRRAMPRLRPPFPAQVGYLGRPTLINNVETLAHVPAILRNGGAWWSELGRRGAPGSRLWSVSGAVAKPGLLRGAERHHDARARRRVRGRVRRRDRRRRARRRGERDPPAGGLRHAADARRAAGVRAQASAPRRCRCSRPRTHRSASSPRRCGSSPRSRARSARRAGSGTGRSTTSARSSSTVAPR